MSQSYRLRPMDLRDILDETFDLYRENFVLFVSISAVLLLPFQLLITLAVGPGLGLGGFNTNPAGPTAHGPSSMEIARAVPTFFGAALLNMIVYYIVIAALTRAISERYLGRSITVREAYDAILHRLKPFFLTLLLTLLAVLGGEVLLVALPIVILAVVAGASPVAGGILLLVFVPPLVFAGLFFWLMYLFVVPVFVIEARAGREALLRSMRLFRYGPGKAFVTLFLIMILVWLLTMIVIAPISIMAGIVGEQGSIGFLMRGVQGAANGIVQALIEPVLLIAIVLLYYDARIRREGFDLEMMANELRAGGAGALMSGFEDTEGTAPDGDDGA